MTTIAARSADDVTDAVRWALASGETLEVVGRGTRRGLGRPVDAGHVLDVSALSGVVAYEPEELILTARPGTTLSEIDALLAERGQCLAFEPPRPISGECTLGGVVGTGLSGPRRMKAGAVRDHLLGVAAVSGRGEAFVGGGKVVKNVTGYDLPKLMAGSYGTLAVLTELTVKVLPAPQVTRTLLLRGLTLIDAVRAMTRVLQTTVDATGACHLPEGVAAPGKAANESATAFRLEGVGPSVEFRLAQLKSLLARDAFITVLEQDASLAFWRAVRDVTPFAGNDDSSWLWRISVPPASGAEVGERLSALPGAALYLDWGGGLIWLACDASAEGAVGPEGSSAVNRARQVREVIAASGGHATLFRAPAEVRRRVEVFQPQAPGVAALSRRVKAQFDPKQVLNPGRMDPGT